jgi:hypothetical protein
MKLLVETDIFYGQTIEDWLLNNAITTTIQVNNKQETYFFSPLNKYEEPLLFLTKQGELVYPELQYKLEGERFFYLKKYQERDFTRYNPIEIYSKLLKDPSTIVETLNPPSPITNVDIVVEPMYSEGSHYYPPELIKDNFYIYLSSKVIERFPSQYIGGWPLYYETTTITKSELGEESLHVHGVNLLDMLYQWYPTLEESISNFINQQSIEEREDNYLTLIDNKEPIIKIYNDTSFDSRELL